MENRKKNSFFGKNLDIIVLFIVSALVLLLVFAHALVKFDLRIYDVLLRMTKEIQVEENILLVDIEDESLNREGSWPWTRDILANALIRMKELGAYNAVFDIEYLSPASKGAAKDIASVTENAFTEGEGLIASAIDEFSSSVERGRIGVSNAKSEGASLTSSVDDVLYDMFDSISSGLNMDYDDYFARAVQFFGNTFLTINAYDIKIDRTEEELEYARKRFLLDNVTDKDQFIQKENEESAAAAKAERAFIPVLQKIGSHAAGAGFTNVILDVDGTRRRIELLQSCPPKFMAQLVFSPLARMLDVQEIERNKKSLVLKGALFPGKEQREDLKIPLDENGRMLINWHHSHYEESFRHVPVYMVLDLDRLEKNILTYLQDLSSFTVDSSSEFGQWLSYIPDVLEMYGFIQSEKERLLLKCGGFDENGNSAGEGILQEEYDSYFTLRSQFFEQAASFASSLAELSKPYGEEVVLAVNNLSESVKNYGELFELLKTEFDSSFCLIGNSATASTDLGVTPFQSGYPNLGTHANIANTILQKSFIRTVGSFAALAAVFAFALLVMLFARRFNGFVKNAVSLIYVLVPVASGVLLMCLLRIYVPLVAPALLVTSTYIAQMVLNYLLTEKEKKTLRRGFDAYVAPEVVNQIVKNPSLLSLGGANKRMTALFSDVRTFSGFTECINREEGEQHGAVRLVDILNGYLGVLSDAIMSCHGTIDKYVGDEIVSFFGAPVDDEFHAYNACAAGIRMKQAEEIYNKEHQKELPVHPVTHTPFLLKSRVGVNTGDMVVGNMGTERKLNYTVMGNNVNLASRLEGTNKAYDSWIMCSESTWKEADSGRTKGLLSARQLDCVRVINVEKPVQIYSIAGFRSELSKEELEAVDLFNKGMEWYLRGREEGADPKDLQDFVKAKKFFEEAYRCFPTTDVQDKSYISMEKKMVVRCENFIVNGLPRDVNGDVIKWDGVYTMTSK